MTLDTRSFPDGTELVYRLPWATYVGGKAKCSDGKIRKLKRIAICADTFFSVQASVNVGKKTVAGYVSTDEEGVKFHAYTYRKNGNVLP